MTDTPKPITIRQAREAGRTVELWMQQNIDAPDDAFLIAGFAWRAMQVAAVPDNRPELAQRDHRRRLRLFAEMTVAWPIIE